MKLWIKCFIGAFVVVPSLFIATIAAVLFTPFGLKFGLWGANYVLPQFTVAASEGALLTGFRLSGLSYQSPDFSLTGKTLAFELDQGCLLQFAVCVNELSVDGVDIVVAQSSSPKKATSSDPVSRIKSPIDIYLHHISLSDISLDVLGNKFAWRSLTSAIEFTGSQLTLKPTHWQGIDFSLASTTNPSQTAPSPASTSQAGAPVIAPATKQALTLPDINIPLDVVVEHVELNDVQLQLAEKQIINQLVLQASAAGNRVEFTTLSLDAPQATLMAKGNISLKGKYPLTLDANSKIHMAPLNDHSLILTATGDLGALHLDVKLAGKLQASLAGDVNVLDRSFPFDAQFTSPHLQWPIDSKEQYSLSSTTLQARGNLDGYTGWLDTAVSGEAFPDIGLATPLSGDLSDFALNNFNIKTLGGTINGSASVNWQHGVTWKTQINFDKIQPERHWPEAKGELSGEIESHGLVNQQGGWSVDVPSFDIKGDILNQSLLVIGKMNASDLKGKGKLRIETNALSVRHGPNYISLSGKVDDQFDLDLLLDIPNLAASIPQAKGKINGNMAISGTLNAPIADIEITANQLDWQEMVSIEDVGIRGVLKSRPLIAGDLVIDVTELKTQGTDISSLSLHISGNKAAHQLALAVKGEPVGANIKMSGTMSADNRWKGVLHDSTVTTPIGPWALAKQVALTFDPKTNSGKIGAFCWTQAPASLCLDEPVSLANSGQAQLSLSEFTLRLLQPLLPPTVALSGAINAKAKLGWQPNTLPNIDGDVWVTQGYVVPNGNNKMKMGWDEVLLTVKLADNMLQGNLNVDLTKNGSININSEMLDLSSSERQLKNTLDIQKINLDILTPLLGNEATISGVINGNVVLDSVIRDGVLDLPDAKGSIVLSKLTLQSLASPVEIKEGNVTLKLDGSQGKISGDITTGDGELELSGHANWPKRNGWKALLNVKGERLKVVMPPMFALEVSPDLTLSAVADEINVTGNVLVPWGRIVVESLPVSAVKVSSDVVMLDDKLQVVHKNKTDAITINAQIGVKIGDDVEFDAFGLKTELVGVLNVASDQFGPTVSGEMNLEKGTYRSFGQDLLIEKGQIIFNGPPDQPYFQIEAIRNPDAIEDGVEAGIRVSGSADAPEVQVFSKPSMPQANALSYLTRGQNLDTDSDGNAMTSMLIGLGLSQSGKLVGQIGEAFGVQNLSLDTSGIGSDEKVEVSGYILPELQVKYGVGIFTRLPEFTVRYKLLQDFYIEAVSGTDNAVDLLYQFTIK